MKNKFILLALGLFCTACSISVPYNVKTDFDEFDKIDTTCIQKNHIQGWQMHWMDLNACKFTSGTDSTYTLYLQYFGPDWLFISDGESLVFLIDGERLGLTSERGSSNHREVDRSSSGVRETAKYLVSPETLKRLAFARNVKAKVRGKQVAEYQLSDSNIRNFRQFYEEQVATKINDHQPTGKK